MDDGLKLEKQSEQLVYYPKSNEFLQELNDKSTMRGFEAYVEGEKRSRLERSIERLSKHTTLSEEELQRLKDSVTEEPQFNTEEGAEFTTLLTKAQKKKLGHFKKKRYNKKEAAYKARLGTWELENLPKLYEQEKSVYRRFYDEEVADVNLEDQINDIDQAFLNQDSRLFEQDETEKSKEEVRKLDDLGIKQHTKAYTGEKFIPYNRLMRNPQYYRATEEDKKDAAALKEGLNKCKIDRTIIVNRGVKDNLKVMTEMLGIKLDLPDRNLTEPQMEEIIKKSVEHIQNNKKEGKDTIVTDPGFVSTSYSPSNPFADEATGIEFVIKVNKGTAAVNVSSLSKYADEKEILLNAGTKFRLLKVYYSGTQKIDGLDYRQTSSEKAGTNRVKKHGKYFLKVYLETIPQEEEGVLKERPKERDNV